jgi:acetylglutamate kinase
MKKPELTVVKIGGHIINDDAALNRVLKHFAALGGPKVLIHGGGNLATTLAKKLNLEQTMIEGRRVTDSETLKIITMVYAGLVNKTMVAKLQGSGVDAIGVTGADGDLIRSKKRAPEPIDFGYVGVVQKVKFESLEGWLSQGMVPVIAPVTHDGQGQLLNTNADTIATMVAISLSQKYAVSLVYTFEKSGVLADVADESSVFTKINEKMFQELKSTGKIFEGMIPKLDSAFQSIQSGVDRVILGKADFLPDLVTGKAGTRLTHE